MGVVLINAGPVPLQSMLSTCQSAQRALIFVRLFCVPPLAAAPGLLVPAYSVTPGAAAVAVAFVLKVTVVPVSWAGENTMNVTGFVILSAEIAAPPE